MMKLSITSVLLFSLIAANVASRESDQQAIHSNEVLNNPGFYKHDDKASLRKFDFSLIWNASHKYLGFRGKHYQRLQIKFLDITKSRSNPDVYYVSGKTKVKDIIHSFSGTIHILTARIAKHIHNRCCDDCESRIIKKQGVVLATYCLAEDPQQKDAGIFSGILSTKWYIDEGGNLQDDDVDAACSDPYCNNQFVGTWQSYHTGLKETANWGHWRIPFSGDLDWGAGNFWPADKYLQYGWQNFTLGDGESNWWEESARLKSSSGVEE